MVNWREGMLGVWWVCVCSGVVRDQLLSGVMWLLVVVTENRGRGESNLGGAGRWWDDRLWRCRAVVGRGCCCVERECQREAWRGHALHVPCAQLRCAHCRRLRRG